MNKRKSLTLGLKLQVINAYDELNNYCKVAHRFQLNRTTVITILENKEKIIQAVNEGVNSKRTHLKNAKNQDLDLTMVNWVKRMRSQNLPISGDLIKVRLND